MNAPDTRPEISKLSHDPNQVSGAAGGMRLSADDYLMFLNKLIAAGSRLPVAMPLIMDGMTDFTAGIKKWRDAAITLAGGDPNVPVPQLLKLGAEDGTDHLPIDPACEDAEQHLAKVLRAYQGDSKMATEHSTKLKAIGDGQLIALFRQLFTFVQANPQLLQWLLSLLVKTPVTPAVQV